MNCLIVACLNPTSVEATCRNPTGAVAVCATVIHPCVDNPYVIEDGVMSDDLWDFFYYNNSEPTIINTSVQIAGGPSGIGTCRRFSNDYTGYGSATPHSSGIFALCTKDRYDPELYGAVLSITYSEQRRTLAGPQGALLVIRQNNLTYVAAVNNIVSGAWGLFSHTYGITSADWQIMNFNNFTLTPGIPNFTRTGNPMSFGVFRSNTSTTGFGAFTSDFDDFRVEITHD